MNDTSHRKTAALAFGAGGTQNVSYKLKNA
jgi:hypothetical protein